MKRSFDRKYCAQSADGMTNSEDPDKTALGAVRSGSALFAKACVSENLQSLRYSILHVFPTYSLTYLDRVKLQLIFFQLSSQS